MEPIPRPSSLNIRIEAKEFVQQSEAKSDELKSLAKRPSALSNPRRIRSMKVREGDTPRYDSSSDIIRKLARDELKKKELPKK